METTFKLNKKQHEKDSEVFGAIMAGARSRKKKLQPTLGSVEDSYSMCAVGAGNRGRKVTKLSDVLTKSYSRNGDSTLVHQLVPLIRFAVANDVTENYACGVNDGFEESDTAARSFYPDVDQSSFDYERGYHVGQAVRIESGY